MKQVARNNHYVPQASLRKWSDQHGMIEAYRTVVSHRDVPLWETRPIRGTAFYRDLYTQFQDQTEIDDVEKWLSESFEQPAFRVIQKLERGPELVREDWGILASFFGCQDLRTPTSFKEATARWNRDIPKVMEELTARVDQLLSGRQSSAGGLLPEPKEAGFQNSFRVQLMPKSSPVDETRAFKVEALLGRSLWLDEITHLLTSTIRVLHDHKWSVMVPFGNTEWITSDHPSMRLNFNSLEEFNFDGGWGWKGTDLILPLTPRYLLHTQVGYSSPDVIQLNRHQTELVQQLLAFRADRWIFSSRRDRKMRKLRRRIVDPNVVKSEGDFWANWHPKNRELELSTHLTPGT